MNTTTFRALAGALGLGMLPGTGCTSTEAERRFDDHTCDANPFRDASAATDAVDP